MNQQTKKCKFCQTDIPVKASRCPNCQGDLRSSFERHPLLVIFLVILIVIIFSNIKGSKSNTTSYSPSTQRTTSSQQETDSQKPNPTVDLLELVSKNQYREYNYINITGTVKNIGNKSLKDVVAVGLCYTEEGEFVKSGDALIDYNPILSGQTSPFHVIFSDNPEITKCAISFKEILGGTIPTKSK